MKHLSNIGQISGNVNRKLLNSTGQTLDFDASFHHKVRGIGPVLELQELFYFEMCFPAKDRAT